MDLDTSMPHKPTHRLMRECTTVDSMLSNWQEGHTWLKENFGAEARPRVGWSLDPFGMSSSQAVLQSLMGMDATVITRIVLEAVLTYDQDWAAVDAGLLSARWIARRPPSS